jgi:5S rRNA maturation endonuclease (ribonuclease M5)
MTPLEILLEKLPNATKAGTGWSARCPAHDDRKASLSVSEGDNETALVNCHAGCATEAVLKVVGLTLKDLFPPKGDKATSKPKPDGKTFATANEAVLELERRHGKRSALWTYHDAKGEPVGVVARWYKPSGKDIRPVARHGDGWRISAMPDPRPLYGLHALAAARRVLVVEGEKAAEAARAMGFTTTTSAGGSAAASKTDWRPLAGKEVWILPDNDAPGRKFADTVAGILAKQGAVVKIIDLTGLPEHGDIVDWIDAHGDAAEPEAMRAEIEALAGAVEEEGVTADAEAFKPFPVEALPEPIRGFVAAGAKAIGCDMSYLALPLLTSLAAAIGNMRRLELKRGWSAPPIIWCAIVGESGTAKTPAFKLVMRPIRERQRKAMERHAEAMKTYEADLARWEKCFAAWKKSKDSGEEPPEKPEPPPCERFIVSDTTVEALSPILLMNPRGLLLARDELAGWLGSFDKYAGKGKASADSAHWLSMFNAENIIVDRKTGNRRS